MPVTLMEISPTTYEMIVQGTLEKSDYQMFIPAIEKTIDEHGEVNLLLNISHFHGWSPAALWEDLKFDVKHYNHVSRLALVSEDSDKEWMATLSKPFTSAKVRFFTEEAHETARQWVLDERHPPA